VFSDASQASLTDLFRSLPVQLGEEETRAALVLLAQEVSKLKHEREHQEMLFEADGSTPPATPGPRHKRDRSHLRVVRSLVAALAMAAGSVPGAVAVTAPPHLVAPLIAAERGADHDTRAPRVFHHPRHRPHWPTIVDHAHHHRP
jgi:hypothetical protein